MRVTWFRLSTLTLAGVLLGIGCNPREGRLPAAKCTFKHLPAGAVMRYSTAGGIMWSSHKITVFEDGRVEVVDSRDPPEVFQVDPGRVEKLVADLRATGALSEEDGCWRGAGADGMGRELVIREKGGAAHGFSEEQTGAGSRAVAKAFEVGAAFRAELRRR